MKVNIPEITSPILCKNVHTVDTYSKNYSTLYQSPSSSLSNSNLPKSINSFSSMNNNINTYSNRNNDCKSNSQKNIYYSQNKPNSNIQIDNYYDTGSVHTMLVPQSSYREQLIQNNRSYYPIYRKKNLNNQLNKNGNTYYDMENMTNKNLFNYGNDSFGYDGGNYNYNSQIGNGYNDQFNNELNVEMELMNMKLKLDLINQKVNKFNEIILPNTLKTIDDEVLFYQTRLNRNKNLYQNKKNGYNNKNISNEDFRYYNSPNYRIPLQGQNNYYNYMENINNDDNLSDLAESLVDNLDNNYLSNDNDTDELIDEIYNFKNRDAIIENEKNEKIKYLQKKKEKKYAVDHSDKEKSDDNEEDKNEKQESKNKKNKKNKTLPKSKKRKIQNLKNRKNKKDNDSSPDSENENENEKLENESVSIEEENANINTNNFRLRAKRKKKIKEEIISVVDIPNMLSNEEKDDKASVANYNNIINVDNKLIDDKKEDIKEENKEEVKESSIKEDEINLNTNTNNNNNNNKEQKGDINSSNTKDNNRTSKPANTDEEDDLVIKEIISNTNKKLYEKLSLIEAKGNEKLNNDSQINADNKNENLLNTNPENNDQQKDISVPQNPPSEPIPISNQVPRKKVTFKDSLLITIQYDQKEVITKLKIKNASNRQVPFHPHNMNKYLTLLYSESPLKSCFTQKFLNSNPQKSTLSYPKKFRIRNDKDIIKRNIEMIKKIGERGCIYDVKNPIKKQKNASHDHCPHCKKFRDNPQKFFTEDLCPNVIKSYNLNVKKCMEKSKEELQRRNTYAEHYLTTVYKSGNDFNIFANKKEMEKIKMEEGDKEGKGYYTDTGEIVCKNKKCKIFKGIMGIKDCKDDDMGAIEEEIGEEGEHNRKHSQ